MNAHNEEWNYGDKVKFDIEWQGKTRKMLGTITSFSQMGGIHYAYIWVAMKNFSGTWKRPLYMLKKVQSNE